MEIDTQPHQKAKGKSFNFLHHATEEQKFMFGTFMWFCFYFGYFVFCLNWLIFSNLEGTLSSDGGWLKQYIGKGIPSGKDEASLKVLKDAVNYSITLARGIATIGVAWLMTKLSHKRASILAFFLNTAALPLIYAPHYALLVIGRMLMATGGTMLIILIQPVISRFFGLKAKGILSSITPTAYIFAALIANVLFIYEGTGRWVINHFLTNWKTITISCAALSYLPLLGYIAFGKSFPTADNPEQEVEQFELPQNTYTGIIKEKNTWFWVFLYSFLLVCSLLVSIKAPDIFEIINPRLVKNTLFGANINWKKIYITFFYAGCMAGLCLGRWCKLKYRRKPIIVVSCAASFFFWVIIFGCAHIQDISLASVLIFYSVFLFAFFSIGIQSVMLYVPHEYEDNNNAKRLTIFYAYLWGFGFIILTLYQIIVVSCLSIPGVWGGYAAGGLISLLVFLYAVFALLIKESRPDYLFFPGWLKFIAFINKQKKKMSRK